MATNNAYILQNINLSDSFYSRVDSVEISEFFQAVFQ